jgi:hypothetical protein
VGGSDVAMGQLVTWEGSRSRQLATTSFTTFEKDSSSEGREGLTGLNGVESEKAAKVIRTARRGAVEHSANSVNLTHSLGGGSLRKSPYQSWSICRL